MLQSFQIHDYLTLLTACIGSTTALIVGYLQRKQMRQIELYKADPSVGVIPPPAWIRVFVKRHATKILILCLIAMILNDLFSTRPLDRWTVLFMALNMSFLVYVIVTKTFGSFIRDIMEILREQMKINKLNQQALVKLADVVESRIEPSRVQQPPTE